eukprot:6664043-Prymnesium_polylepis.3
MEAASRGRNGPRYHPGQKTGRLVQAAWEGVRCWGPTRQPTDVLLVGSSPPFWPQRTSSPPV